MTLKKYILCLSVCLCILFPFVSAATPAYDVLETTKGKLVAVSTQRSPVLFLRDNRTVFSLKAGNSGFWTASVLPPAEEKALLTNHPKALLPYDARTTIYLKTADAYYRLTATEGGFSQSAPLQERSFLLIAGEPTGNVYTSRPAPVSTSTPASASISTPAPAAPNSVPVPTCKTSWPAAADPNKPFGGMFYGTAAHGEGTGFTGQFEHQASIRFRADRTGSIKEVSFLNRLYRTTDWEALVKQRQGDTNSALSVLRDHGTHRGNGGALAVEIRTDNGGTPSDTVLAKSLRNISPIGAHAQKIGALDGIDYLTSNAYDTFPAIRLDRMARLEAGKLYHIVLTQTSERTGRVALSGNQVGSPLTPPGGPYYGCGAAMMWRDSASGSWQYAPRLLPLYTLTYADGTVLGQTVEARHQLEQIIGGPSIVRQQFTVRGESMDVTGFYIRMRRQLGGGPLYASLIEGNNVVITLNIPPEIIPQLSQTSQPMPWTYIAFPKRISLLQGKTYRLQFSTDSASRYALGVNETLYDLTRDTRMVWGGQQSQAQNSMDGGRTWDNWATGTQTAMRKATERPNADLPVLFTLANKPTKLQ